MSNTKDYRLIGITGPTGSGKGTVSRFFAEHGYAVVDADEIAHLALGDVLCISKLTDTFGNEILSTDGSINRKALAAAAFSTAENTQKLNSITHPVIIELAKERFLQLSDSGYKNIIFDAPTLFESGSDKLCDIIIAVVATEETRLERIMKRDGLSKQEATARMNAQKPLSFYTDRADYVIVNDTNEASLRIATENIIKELSL